MSLVKCYEYTLLFRVDTRVSLVQNFREFHVKRVSYFAKKILLVSRNFLFRETGVRWVCVLSVCGEFIWRLCVLSVSGECVWWVCLVSLFGECEWWVGVVSVCSEFVLWPCEVIKRYKTRAKGMKFEEKAQNFNKNIQKYEMKHCFAVAQKNLKHFFSYFFSFTKRSKLGETVTCFVQFCFSWN